jgi:hypothetical protein
VKTCVKSDTITSVLSTRNTPGCYTTNCKLRGDFNITTVLIADDQLLLAENEYNLQRATTKLNEVTKKYSMKISSGKIKMMAMHEHSFTCGLES